MNSFLGGTYFKENKSIELATEKGKTVNWQRAKKGKNQTCFYVFTRTQSRPSASRHNLIKLYKNRYLAEKLGYQDIISIFFFFVVFMESS